MSNDYENLAKIILSTPQGAKIFSNLEKIENYMSGAEGTELLHILAEGGADAIKQAAIAAIDGENDKVRCAVSSLLSTKEGAALSAKLLEIMR